MKKIVMSLLTLTIMAMADSTVDGMDLKFHKGLCDDINTPGACVNVSYIYSTKMKWQEALKYGEKACDLNSEDGCYMTGIYYISEKTSLLNPKKGLKYFEKACSMDVADACFQAGQLYTDEKVNMNRKKAIQLFTKACKLGSKNACYITDRYRKNN